jgi:hypothetical protein
MTEAQETLIEWLQFEAAAGRRVFRTLEDQIDPLGVSVITVPDELKDRDNFTRNQIGTDRTQQSSAGADLPLPLGDWS